jgi:hypothetical protein
MSANFFKQAVDLAQVAFGRKQTKMELENYLVWLKSLCWLLSSRAQTSLRNLTVAYEKDRNFEQMVTGDKVLFA